MFKNCLSNQHNSKTVLYYFPSLANAEDLYKAECAECKDLNITVVHKRLLQICIDVPKYLLEELTKLYENSMKLYEENEARLKKVIVNQQMELKDQEERFMEVEAQTLMQWRN